MEGTETGTRQVSALRPIPHTQHGCADPAVVTAKLSCCCYHTCLSSLQGEKREKQDKRMMCSESKCDINYLLLYLSTYRAGVLQIYEEKRKQEDRMTLVLVHSSCSCIALSTQTVNSNCTATFDF